MTALPRVEAGRMTARTKLLAFALILLASFGVGAALGSSLPDLGPEPAPAPVAPHGGTGP